MCIDEGRKTMTGYYCSLCTVTANREQDRKPSKHAYCMKPEFNCYSRHIALCYQHMNRTGMTAQRYAMRKETKNSMTQGGGPRALELPIAGKVVWRAIPK